MIVQEDGLSDNDRLENGEGLLEIRHPDFFVDSSFNNTSQSYRRPFSEHNGHKHVNNSINKRKSSVALDLECDQISKKPGRPPQNRSSINSALLKKHISDGFTSSKLFSRMKEALKPIASETNDMLKLRTRLDELHLFKDKMEIMILNKKETCNVRCQTSPSASSSTSYNPKCKKLPIPSISNPSRTHTSQAPRAPPPITKVSLQSQQQSLTSRPSLTPYISTSTQNVIPTTKDSIATVVKDTTKCATVSLGDIIDLTGEEELTNSRKSIPNRTTNNTTNTKPLSSVAPPSQSSFRPANSPDLVNAHLRRCVPSDTPQTSPVTMTTEKRTSPLPPLPTDSGSNVSSIPAPKLFVTQIKEGVSLQWDIHHEITKTSRETPVIFEVFSFASVPPGRSEAMHQFLWSKVGQIRALPLPMTCTLIQLTPGNTYHFAIRCIDNLDRLGPWSNVSTSLIVA